MPLPINTAANRCGKRRGAAAESTPHTGRDSSQGKAITTPAPRRKVLREIRWASADESFTLRMALVPFRFGSFGSKLGAANDALDESAKTVTIRGKLRSHLADERIV